MKDYCKVNYLECCKCQPCCGSRIRMTEENAEKYREYIKQFNNKSTQM
jgi:hypothetical protein